MLEYHQHLQNPARDLRKNQTEAEKLLWSRLRRKQLCGVQFYRQKPIAGFIVDFYCASAQLVIELDGKHHGENNQLAYDRERTLQLEALELRVIRFSNQFVLNNLELVTTEIQAILQGRLYSPL
jgi:very-short-patch-repair endonuclease